MVGTELFEVLPKGAKPLGGGAPLLMEEGWLFAQGTRWSGAACGSWN